MYQMINGKRNPPSQEIILRISDVCGLSPSEREELIEAAKITRIGEDAYLRQKQVELFLIHFPRRMSKVWRAQTPDTVSSTEDDWPYLPQHYSAFLENMDLNIAIRRILIQEAKHKNGNIRLILQPDIPYVFQILHSLVPRYPITIEHLICLGNISCRQNGALDQFAYLENFLPFFVPRNIRYLPYYFYDSIESHYYNLNGMSCMILTTKYAILCSSDFHCGVFSSQPDFVKGFNSLFLSYQAKCSPLAETISMDISNISTIEKINSLYAHTQNYYFIDAFACIVPFFTKPILDRIISSSLAGREQLIEVCDTMLTADREMLSSKTRQYYITREELAEFTKTGGFFYSCSRNFSPLCPEDRVAVLENIKQQLANGNHHILRSPLESLSPELSLCVCEEFVYLRLGRSCHDQIYILFREPNLLSIFLEYFDNLPENAFYSQDEAAAYIQEMIQSLA